MKAAEFWNKIRACFNKAGKKTVIAACTVLALGGAVILNVALSNAGNDGENRNKDFAIDLTDANAGEKNADNVSISSYFASMTLSRQQARDEAMEVLLAVAENSAALEEAKQVALDDINKLAAEIATESNIETLILSKGFSQCIAILNNDNCNVIVESGGLLPTEIAQISEIVYEQSGVIPANLKIIEKNPSNIET